MAKEDEYRQNAAATIRLAQRAATGAEKRHLLKLAESWLDLSDRAHQRALRFRGRPILVDPLVGQKLDRHLED
jgi:hypothetical protein